MKHSRKQGWWENGEKRRLQGLQVEGSGGSGRSPERAGRVRGLAAAERQVCRDEETEESQVVRRYEGLVVRTLSTPRLMASSGGDDRKLVADIVSNRS